MPKARLHHLRVNAGPRRCGRNRVPQVVQANDRDARISAGAFELKRRRCGWYGSPDLVDEDVATVHPTGARGETLLELPAPMECLLDHSAHLSPPLNREYSVGLSRAERI